MKLDYDYYNHDHTIICDLDDTISVSITHDWQNAKPNEQLINKINRLYDEGWQIIILTARGQVSCQGDVEKADKKYRKKIETWLKRHHVKYHKLSFHKYLGSGYVDDKSLTPDEFVNLDVKEIKTGWSGARVEKRGDRIYKSHSDALNVAKWYEMSAPLINVPIVHNVIGHTLSLEYLKPSGHKFKIDEVNSAISKFSMYRTYKPFVLYIERIKKHCEVNNDFWNIIPLLVGKEEYFNQFSTFMHGDFSIENIIQTDKGMFLIDPIYEENQWSSYLLDISKMMHSYRKYNRMFEYEVFLNGWIKNGYGIDEWALRLLEVSWYIRLIKYVPDEYQKKEFIKITKELLENVRLALQN